MIFYWYYYNIIIKIINNFDFYLKIHYLLQFNKIIMLKLNIFVKLRIIVVKILKKLNKYIFTWKSFSKAKNCDKHV